uniref:Uncharacterized protein n=1 Tax=Sander lucioperca TaxID=283035 RepID=A0A8C9ZCQ9_SANLU
MERLGLGAKFIDMVCTLYVNPTAIVSTNGLHSQPFPIKRGSSSSESLFAYNILLYIADLEDSIPKILMIFNEFDSISSYKMNWNKSNLLFLNNRHVASTISVTIPTQSKITYLGITIHASLQRVAGITTLQDCCC